MRDLEKNAWKTRKMREEWKICYYFDDQMQLILV